MKQTSLEIATPFSNSPQNANPDEYQDKTILAGWRAYPAWKLKSQLASTDAMCFVVKQSSSTVKQPSKWKDRLNKNKQ